MPYQSLVFIFLFLPISLVIFYICPNKGKVPVLAVTSLLFYVANDPENLPLLLGSLLFDYLMGHWIVLAKGDLKQRKTPFWLCICKNLVLMLCYGVWAQLGNITSPLGLLIFTTTSMGYIIDVYHGDDKFDPNLFRFILFCTFFGKLYIGPIVQYGDMRKNLDAFTPAISNVEQKDSVKAKSLYWGGPAFSLEGMSQGLSRFIGGLAKVVILAGGSGKVFEKISDIPQGSSSVLSYWMLVISFTFHLYFNLSGYCDMAVGLAKMFGLDMPENFHHPFQSRTVSDFFNRFNITVTQFINRYVYVFLGGDSNGVVATIVNTLLTTMLMGIWFGIKLNYIVWGIYFTVFILLEKYWLLKYLEKFPPAIDRIYTFAAVMMSFTIFQGRSLQDSVIIVSSMFGLRGLPILNSQITYILSSNYLVIFLCFLFATSLVSMLAKFVREHYSLLANFCDAVSNVALLAVTISFML